MIRRAVKVLGVHVVLTVWDEIKDQLELERLRLEQRLRELENYYSERSEVSHVLKRQKTHR